MNPNCGPTSGNVHPAHLNAAQQQQGSRRAPNMSYPEYVGVCIGEAIAQRIAYRVAEGFEYVAWSGFQQVKGAYHWAWPTKPEHVRKAASFCRREINEFISKASKKEGAEHIMLQAHRVPEKLRNELIRDGYDVREVQHFKQPAVRISWERTKQE